MSLAFAGSNTDQAEYTIASAATNLAQFTVWAWVYPSGFANGLGIWQQEAVAGTGYRNLYVRSTGQFGTECDFDTTNPFSRSANSGGNILTTGKWWLAVGTLDGSAVPHNYLADLTTAPYEVSYLTQTTGAGSSVTDSGGTGRWGNRGSGGSLSFNGRIGRAGLVNRALSLAEIAVLWRRGKFPSGSVMGVQLGHNGTGTQFDFSGNGQSGTVSGAAVADEAPLKPIWWIRQPWYVAPGGTTYDQAAAGSLAVAGAMARSTTKALSGTSSQAGALVRSTAKALAGSVASSGALTTLLTFLQTVAGAITPSGALVRSTTKVLVGSLPQAGALVRSTIKVVAGTVAGAGALVKTVTKIAAGTMGGTGAMATTLVFLRAVAGTLGSAGALTKTTVKTLAGSFAPSGAIGRQVAKALAGVLAIAGTVAKTTSKVFAGALGHTGALATVYTAASNIRQIALTLHARSTTLTLQERVAALTLQARSLALTLLDRD